MPESEITPSSNPAPSSRPPVSGGILPGMAAITMFLLLVAMLNAFAALRGAFGQGMGRIGIFSVCTLLVVGVFGFLRLRRWGWALITAGCLLMSSGDIYLYLHIHVGFFLVRSLLELCFFLYLVRAEVRDRVH